MAAGVPLGMQRKRVLGAPSRLALLGEKGRSFGSRMQPSPLGPGAMPADARVAVCPSLSSMERLRGAIEVGAGVLAEPTEGLAQPLLERVARSPPEDELRGLI